MFPSMADRAWFAWQALDRDKLNRPPAIRALERAHGISNAGLSKLIKGQLTKPGFDVLTNCAAALRTTPEWLSREIGEGPVSRWPIPPRPAEWGTPKSKPAKNPKKKTTRLAEELQHSTVASESGALRIAQRGAKEIPSRVTAELPNKSKARSRR